VYQSEHKLLAITRAIRTKIATCGLAEETEKKKNGGRRKSQNRYISPPCGGVISQPICTKSGKFVDIADVITPAKFKWFFHAEKSKYDISLWKSNGLCNSAMRYRAGLW